MAKSLPYYPLYVDDFDEDPNVLAMNLAEVGLYQLALNESWKRGSIPAEPKALAVLIRRKPAEVCRAWPKVQPCWIENGIPGRLVNPRQERERDKANGLSEVRAQAARLSHSPASRRFTGPPANAGDLQEHLQTYGSVSESAPSGTLPQATEKTSTRAQGDFVDFDTFLHRWKAHRGFKKPTKPVIERAEQRWGMIQITEDDLGMALDGYFSSTWAKGEGYPLLAFVKDPHSWTGKPETETEPVDDSGFDEFQLAYPGVSIPSDWDKARPIWCGLPLDEREKAKIHVAGCDPAFVKSPRNYLRDKEFLRPPRPEPKSASQKLLERA